MKKKYALRLLSSCDRTFEFPASLCKAFFPRLGEGPFGTTLQNSFAEHWMRREGRYCRLKLRKSDEEEYFIAES